jgi:hypothetical protein
MTVSTTLIRVPVATRDRVRSAAAAQGVTFGQIIERGLDLLSREQFWDRVAAIRPDDEYRREFAAWDAWED